MHFAIFSDMTLNIVLFLVACLCLFIVAMILLPIAIFISYVLLNVINQVFKATLTRQQT